MGDRKTTMKSAVPVQCPKISANAPGGSRLISLAAVIVDARNPAGTRKTEAR